MPDMVFPNNKLILTHTNGAEISFNALDALKTVNNGRLPFKVACAEVWQESRYFTMYLFIVILKFQVKYS